jgi:hypothetical protein
MRLRSTLILVILFALFAVAQTAELREVKNGTLVSKSDPAVTLTIDKSFQYAGGQSIDILKVAGAEQHLFIDAAPDHSIRRFYLVQFEHYYPDNKYTYNFSGIPQKPVALGRLAFMGDVRVSPNYFTMDDRPGSDSKAEENFLRSKGFKLDGTYVTLRLFHLPDDSKRKELMIIYGELLPSGASEEKIKSEITKHAQANIKVQ